MKKLDDIRMYPKSWNPTRTQLKTRRQENSRKLQNRFLDAARAGHFRGVVEGHEGCVFEKVRIT